MLPTTHHPKRHSASHSILSEAQLADPLVPPLRPPRPRSLNLVFPVPQLPRPAPRAPLGPHASPAPQASQAPHGRPPIPRLDSGDFPYVGQQRKRSFMPALVQTTKQLFSTERAKYAREAPMRELVLPEAILDAENQQGLPPAFGQLGRRLGDDSTPPAKAKVLPWVQSIRDETYDEPRGMVGPYEEQRKSTDSSLHHPLSSKTGRGPTPSNPLITPFPQPRRPPVVYETLAEFTRAQQDVPTQDMAEREETPGLTMSVGKTDVNEPTSQKPSLVKDHRTHSERAAEHCARTYELLINARPPGPEWSPGEPLPHGLLDGLPLPDRRHTHDTLATSTEPSFGHIHHKEGRPIARHTMETMATSTTPSFGHVHHKDGRPVAPPQRVPPGATAPTGHRRKSSGGKLIFTPLSNIVEQAEPEGRSAYVETVTDEEAEKPTKQTATAGRLGNPKHDRISKALTISDLQSELAEEIEIMTSVSDVRTSQALTTISQVGKMIDRSTFHDETLCQLLDAARLHLIGEEAKKALVRAARARVIELRDMKDSGETAPSTPPLMIRKRRKSKSGTRDVSATTGRERNVSESTVRQRNVSTGTARERNVPSSTAMERAPANHMPHAREMPRSVSRDAVKIIEQEEIESTHPVLVHISPATPPAQDQTELRDRIKQLETRLKELESGRTPRSVADSAHFRAGMLDLRDIIDTPRAQPISIPFPLPFDPFSAAQRFPPVGAAFPHADAKQGSIHTIPSATATPAVEDPQPAPAPAGQPARGAPGADPISWGSSVELPPTSTTPVTAPGVPRINILPPTADHSKHATPVPTSYASRSSRPGGSAPPLSSARTKPALDRDRDLPDLPVESAPSRAKNSSAPPTRQLVTPKKRDSAWSATSTNLAPAMTESIKVDRIKVFDPLSPPLVPMPWDHVTQRLYNWATVWEESMIESWMADISLGLEVSELPLSVFGMMTYKRTLRSRMTQDPPLACDKLFVPPIMADSINKAVFANEFGAAKLLIEQMWYPFGFDEPPRVIVSLTRHGSHDAWMAHRYDLTNARMTSYLTAHDASVNAPLDGRPFRWWEAIRLAWPQLNLPDFLDLEQSIRLDPLPREQRHNASVRSAVIARNLILGNRPEIEYDLGKIRENIWGELKRLLLKKRHGKLAVGHD